MLWTNREIWFKSFRVLLWLGGLIPSLVYPQAGIDKPKRKDLSAFEIMELVYDQMRYLEGINKFQLTITTRKGSTAVYKGVLYVKGDSSLYHFDHLSRGRVLKILLNDLGANIFAYSTHEKKLFHKIALDRFDPVLDSGFFYVDLANAPFLDYYTPKISGNEKRAGGRDWLRVENIPLDVGKYGKLVVLVDPYNDYSLQRIDYFDTAGVLMKSLEVQIQSLPIKESDGKERVIQRIARWDMMDLSRGTVSTLEFFSNDKSARLDNSLFRKENLEK